MINDESSIVGSSLFITPHLKKPGYLFRIKPGWISQKNIAVDEMQIDIHYEKRLDGCHRALKFMLNEVKYD
ncbi:MAG: hypothetical protein WCR46_05380 [Deltaproteobacteria bacterium]|jgi:hypothetical protein